MLVHLILVNLLAIFAILEIVLLVLQIPGLYLLGCILLPTLLQNSTFCFPGICILVSKRIWNYLACAFTILKTIHFLTSVCCMAIMIPLFTFNCIFPLLTFDHMQCSIKNLLQVTFHGGEGLPVFWKIKDLSGKVITR